MTHENKDYVKALHDKGYRVTPQRLIVLDAVCAHQGHATLADIQASVYEMDPTIDRSTIYRALDVLQEVGLIIEVEIGETGKVYTVAGEADHLHLVCLACGKVLTIPPNKVEPLLKYLKTIYRFEIQIDHMVFNGFCGECNIQNAK